MVCHPPVQQMVGPVRTVSASASPGGAVSLRHIERFTVETIASWRPVVVFFIAHAQDRSQTIKHGDDNNQQDEVNEIDDGLL